jgi:hypothetical protein
MLDDIEAFATALAKAARAVRSVNARKRGIVIGFLPYEAAAHDMVQGRF